MRTENANRLSCPADGKPAGPASILGEAGPLFVVQSDDADSPLLVGHADMPTQQGQGNATERGLIVGAMSRMFWFTLRHAGVPLLLLTIYHCTFVSDSMQYGHLLPWGWPSAKQARDPWAPMKRTIVLVGTTGTGKSSLGNALLGIHPSCGGESDCAYQSFHTCTGADSCTLGAQAIDGFWLADDAKPVRIIDTPGHGDGKGRDNELRRNFVDRLKKEKVIHAIIWVKNSAAPRFDKLDADFLSIFHEMFGPGFLNNVAVVMTRYSYDPASEARRRRAGEGGFEDTVASVVRASLGDASGPNEDVPVLAIDAMHNPDNRAEVGHFLLAADELWAVVRDRFSERPLEDIRHVQDKVERLQAERDDLQKKLGKLVERGRQEDRKTIEDLQKLLATLERNYAAASELFERQRREPPRSFSEVLRLVKQYLTNKF